MQLLGYIIYVTSSCILSVSHINARHKIPSIECLILGEIQEG